jgi:prenyltransferase beta subunit
VLSVAHEFEEVRMAAAAVEAWGAENRNLGELRESIKADRAIAADDPRVNASELVTWMRLKSNEPYKKWVVDRLAALEKTLLPSQRTDGGWGKVGEKTSDIESTYRVMRAFKMLDSKPKDIAKLREFLASHRNKDGGYATKPGEASSAGGTYFAVIISKWLDEMEAKK